VEVRVRGVASARVEVAAEAEEAEEAEEAKQARLGRYT